MAPPSSVATPCEAGSDAHRRGGMADADTIRSGSVIRPVGSHQSSPGAVGAAGFLPPGRRPRADSHQESRAAEDTRRSHHKPKPGGQPRTAKRSPAGYPLDTTAGTTQQLWVSSDGQPTDAPLQDSQVIGSAYFAGTFSVIALAVLLTITGMVTRWTLDKRRMAAWDAEWRGAGPRWTTRA
jgi:hypothetical protein